MDGGRYLSVLQAAARVGVAGWLARLGGWCGQGRHGRGRGRQWRDRGSYESPGAMICGWHDFSPHPRARRPHSRFLPP